MIKILIICPDILPVPAVKGGAVETIIQQLVESNSNSKKDYVEYTVYSIHDKLINENNSKKSKHNYIHFRNSFFFRKLSSIFGKVLTIFSQSRVYGNFYVRKACQVASDSDYNYIIIENQPEYALILRGKTKAKIILHLHNDKLDSNSNFSNRIISSVDYIFTVSGFVKQKVETISSCNKSKVKVLYNCVDIERYSFPISLSEKESVRNKYAVCLDSKVITFIGRLDKTKGVLELIQAFNKLTDKNLTLLIVGASWFSDNRKSKFMDELQYEIDKASNPIVFTGYVEHVNIPLIQMSSDILVVPSVSVDACPLVVLESMASGVPLVSTDSGGIPELVPDKHGLLVERQNGGDYLVEGLVSAFDKILSDQDYSVELSNNALKYVGYFDVKDYSDRLEILIKDIEDNV